MSEFITLKMLLMVQRAWEHFHRCDNDIDTKCGGENWFILSINFATIIYLYTNSIQNIWDPYFNICIYILKKQNYNKKLQKK